MSNEQVLAELNSDFRAKVADLIARLRTAGLHPVLTFGVRDPWTQARLWRKSRSGAQVVAKIEDLNARGAPYLAEILREVGPQPHGRWATDAAPGLSWHQWREAVDFGWKSQVTGRVLEGGPDDGDEFQFAEQCYDKLGELCDEVGLTWGDSFGDENHVQGPTASSPLRELSYAEVDARIRVLWPRQP